MKRLMVTLSLLFAGNFVHTLHATQCNTCNPCTSRETICTCTNDCCGPFNDDHELFGKTHFTARSQGRATYRWLVGTHEQPYQYDASSLSAIFSVITEYNHNFKQDALGTFLLPTGASGFVFGPDTEFILNGVFSDDTSVRGQDFGLASTYKGCVCIAPDIATCIADFHLELFGCGCLTDLFGYIDVPLVYTQVTPLHNARDAQDGDPLFANCLMSPAATPVGALTAQQALAGNFTWGQVAQPLQYGIICGTRSKMGVADIRAGLGYMIMTGQCAQLGIKLVAAAPTGNSPQARFLAEPIIGNQGHWELGGGIVGHAILWQKNDDTSVSFHLDSEFTHLFTSRTQKRLFDLHNNCAWSRYLLLKEFAADAQGNPDYIGLERGPNVFAQEVKISIDIQTDMTALISFVSCGWIIDMGYNLWARSREKATDVCCCIAKNRYGIKGVVGVCDDTDPGALNTASRSTIRTSKGINGGIDDGPTPVFVSCGDLNVCSALCPSAWSNAVIVNIGHAWQDCPCSPFLGIGAKVEFSGKTNSALNQWGIWFKGAFEF